MRTGNYDRIASVYTFLECITFGRKLQNWRLKTLGFIQQTPSTIAMLGEGRGRLLPKLAQAYPKATIYYVDSSMRMLEITRKKYPNLSNIKWICHNATNWTPPEPIELVVSLFFLDSFTQPQLEELIEHYKPHLTTQGQWIWADFARSSTLSQRWLLLILYKFFRATTGLPIKTLPKISEAFENQGLKQVKYETSNNRLFEIELRTNV